MVGVRGFADAIREVTGSTPSTCPWAVFSNPFVSDVMTVRQAQKAGMLPPLDHIPQRVLDGATYYANALDAANADRMKREQKEREAQRPQDH